VSASDTADLDLPAGNIAVGTGSAGVGASAAILVRSGVVDAAVHQGAQIVAGSGNGLVVSATQNEDLLLISVSGAGGNSAGVAGSAVVDVMTNTTTAHVDENVTVGAGSAGLQVAAKDTTSILSIAGALAIGGTAGVGAGVDVEVINKDTEAWVGNLANVTVSGNATVDATSHEDLTSIAVGGGFGGTAAVNVNVGVSVFNVTTNAFIDGGPLAGDGASVSADGSVRVGADESLSLNVIGGNLSVAGTAAVGAAAAVPVVTKETHAYIGDHAKVNAKGGSGVTASTGTFDVNTQDTRFDPSQAGVIEGDGSTINLGFNHGFAEDDRVLYDSGGKTAADSINGLHSVATNADQVYYVHKVSDTEVQLKTQPGGTTAGGKLICPTSNLVCSLSAPAVHGESHRLVPTAQAGVRQDQSPRFNPATDISGGSTITLPYDLGSLDAGDKVVYSSGGGQPIGGLVDGGTYYAIVVATGNPTKLKLAATYCDAVGTAGDADNCPQESGVDHPVTPIVFSSNGTGKSHSIVKNGQAPAGDASETGLRDIKAKNDGVNAFRGVAVTATNSDDIAGVGVSAGFSGTAAVNLSGVVDVIHANTSASIGKSAKVNCGATCDGNVGGANTGQSVRVVAGNQFHELAVAATLAIAGTVGVGVGIGVHLVTLNTDAYIDDSARVNAMNDIVVSATGQESLITVVAGASGGTVGVAGTLTVTILNTHTYACVGNWANDGTGCANSSFGAHLVAGNNIRVAARDETKILQITASLAGGFVGVGVAVGVASVSKDTQAFLGPNTHADALASRSSTATAYTGNYVANGDLGFQTGGIQGLAVQSASKEDIFGLAASVGGGFVGVAGGVGVTLIHVTTKSWIGQSSQVNQLGGGDSDQAVNVSAVDFFKSLTVAGGAAGGFVGVAGGIDIGVADSSVQAFIQGLANVSANGDVEVNALSRKQVQTYALSLGVGFVGVAGSVSVWSVGSERTTT
ncbi:MAG: hypothetical protein ACJ77N_11475, partial [Chloroflexota bacterium]